MSSEYPSDPNRPRAINPFNFRTGEGLADGALDELSVSVLGEKLNADIERYKIAKQRVEKYLRTKCGFFGREIPNRLIIRLMEKYGVKGVLK